MALLPEVANSEGNNEILGDRSPLEAGDYIVCITKSEFKATKAETGYYLNLTMIVQEGPRTGSFIWTLLNLKNPNPVAVEMAKKELNSICQACSLNAVEDSDELHGIHFGITVSIKKGDAQYPDSNKIDNYKPANEVSLSNPRIVSQELKGAPPQASSAVAKGAGTAPETEKAEVAATANTATKLPWE